MDKERLGVNSTHPNEVGHRARDAIRGGKFWILTHPNMAKIVTKQVGALAADQSLTGL